MHMTTHASSNHHVAHAAHAAHAAHVAHVAHAPHSATGISNVSNISNISNMSNMSNISTSGNINCRNCGQVGHVYKSCNFPIISYGLICSRPSLVTPGELDYIMIQRKDSLSYIEFIRGKYKLENYTYLKQLFTNMTIAERRVLKGNTPFEQLWNSVWYKPQSPSSSSSSCSSSGHNHTSHTSHNHSQEFYESKEKFEQLMSGYKLKMEDGSIIHVNMAHVLAITVDTYTDSEWGFPKGRRRLKELDAECAVREFCEETGYAHGDVQILSMKPYDETFLGTNHVRYRHVYFLAKIVNLEKNAKVDPSNLGQVREVRDVQWFNADEVVAHIRDHNVERKQLFLRIAKPNELRQ